MNQHYLLQDLTRRTVDMEDFEEAKDKIFMGPERKSLNHA